MTIARPLPVGVTGDGELCAIDLDRECAALEFAKALHAELPPGLALREIVVEGRLSRSPLGGIARAEYTVALEGPTFEDLAEALGEVLAGRSVEIERETKSGRRRVHIRPGILAAQATADPLGLYLELACTDEYLVKPEEVVEAVNEALAGKGLASAAVVRVHRKRLLTGEWASPVQGHGEPSRV